MNRQDTTSMVEKYPWITKELFQRVIKEQVIGSNDIQVVVEKLEAEPAVPKGENYSSQLISVSCDYKAGKDSKSIKFVVKAPLPKQPNHGPADIFLKEIHTYNVLMPKIVKVLNNNYIKSKLGPKCYHTDESNRYLIFEDLRTSGYYNIDKQAGLSYKHLETVVTRIAQIHAASAVVIQEDPNEKEFYNSKRAAVTLPESQDFYVRAVKSFANVSEDWVQNQNIMKKLHRLEKEVVKRNTNCFHDNVSKFNVINHGDLWTNNIMFKGSDSNNPEDHTMIDFALGFYGTPVIDLASLFFSSSGSGISEIEWDKLMKHYHDTLVMLLAKMNYKGYVPTLRELQVEFLTKTDYAMSSSITLVSLRYLNPNDSIDILEFVGDSVDQLNYRRRVLSSNNYRMTTKHLLEYFDRKGMLD